MTILLTVKLFHHRPWSIIKGPDGDLRLGESTYYMAMHAVRCGASLLPHQIINAVVHQATTPLPMLCIRKRKHGGGGVAQPLRTVSPPKSDAAALPAGGGPRSPVASKHAAALGLGTPPDACALWGVTGCASLAAVDTICATQQHSCHQYCVFPQRNVPLPSLDFGCEVGIFSTKICFVSGGQDIGGPCSGARARHGRGQRCTAFGLSWCRCRLGRGGTGSPEPGEET